MAVRFSHDPHLDAGSRDNGVGPQIEARNNKPSLGNYPCGPSGHPPAGVFAISPRFLRRRGHGQRGAEKNLSPSRKVSTLYRLHKPQSLARARSSRRIERSSDSGPVPSTSRSDVMRSGGRVVEGARLESEYTPKAYPGFESLPLRHFLWIANDTVAQALHVLINAPR